MDTQLDPDAINLAKAIRQTESNGNFRAKGKSGEYGAYQFTEPTWNSYSKKYGVNVPLNQATPEQQNEVAYRQIKEWKDKGFNVGQVASMWNAGEGNKNAYLEDHTGTNKYGVHFDTPAYAKSVASAYQELKQGRMVGADPNNPSSINSTVNASVKPREGGYHAPFQSNKNDTPLTTGLKAVGNIIPSAVNFGKEIVNSLNPMNTLRNITSIPEAYKEAKEANQGSISKTIGGLLGSIPSEAYKAVVPTGVRQVVAGDISGATKTFTEDPFGQAAPVVLAAQGAAGLADNLASKSAMKGYVGNIAENTVNRVPIPKPTTKYSGMFNKAVETIASPITKPTNAVVGKVGDLSGAVATSLASRLTGMEPETIRQILSDPKSFSKIEMDNATRGGLAGEVQTSIETRLDDLKDTGRGYDAIRGSNQTVNVPPRFIESILEENGLQVKKSKVVADTNSVTRNTSDINALQKFYNDWSKKTTLTPNEFLNMRGDLGELSKFDKITGMGKTRASETMGKALYDRANKMIRDSQLEELKALDESYAPEKQFLKGVKKDFFNADGTPKDNIASKIANAGNKVELLKRLEKVMPGITKRIQIIKAAEDIERASGNKVGAYTRIIPGVLGFAAGGVMSALLAEILTSPDVAVPVLRKAGMLGAKAIPIVQALRTVAGEGNKKSFLIPGLLSDKSSIKENTKVNQ